MSEKISARVESFTTYAPYLPTILHSLPMGAGECPVRFYWALAHPMSGYYLESEVKA